MLVDNIIEIENKVSKFLKQFLLTVNELSKVKVLTLNNIYALYWILVTIHDFALVKVVCFQL